MIRKVNAAGVISTVAGHAGERSEWGRSNDGGPATQAGIYLNSEHNGLAVDSAGNLYIADEGHNRIRRSATSPRESSPRSPVTERRVIRAMAGRPPAPNC